MSDNRTETKAEAFLAPSVEGAVPTDPKHLQKQPRMSNLKSGIKS